MVIVEWCGVVSSVCVMVDGFVLFVLLFMGCVYCYVLMLCFVDVKFGVDVYCVLVLLCDCDLGM